VPLSLTNLGTQSGLGPEREAGSYLPRNPDPGSTPGFDPDSESNAIVVRHNKSQ